MKQSQTQFVINTDGQGLSEVTGKIAAWVAEQGIGCGLLTVFIRHTSASLLIQENADPSVCRDLMAFFADLAPEVSGHYHHTTEGLDDMPAHLRAALTQVQLSIPVIDRRMCLGTWQGIYVFEHRSRPHKRTLVLHLMGEEC